MSILLIISLAALALCLTLLFAHFVRIVKLGKPKDYSEPSGSVAKGVVYSNTAAMSPTNKESAYLHLPTYTLGIFFHLGIFLSFLLYLLIVILHFCGMDFRALIADNVKWLQYLLAAFLLVTTCCGIVLFIKRLVNKNLHSFASLDDYLSNLFTTLFQLGGALYFMALPGSPVIYFILCTILFLYMPFGKLKHLLYYFAARYHLGFFYGRRNVWPPQRS